MIENQSRLGSAVETGLRDVFGGAISGVVSVIYCVSYAAFIFSGPLAPWLGYWHRRDLHLDDDRRISRGAAQLRALHHSRAGQLHVCRHRDPGGCLCPVARRKRRDRPCSWVNTVSYGAWLGGCWNCSVLSRTWW